jgi:S-adenosylmethionine-diacylgycerolhomoserine-N-methlytransferase
MAVFISMSSTDKARFPTDVTGAASAAALMDRIYRNQRHIYDLTRKFYLLGRDGLIAALDPPAGGTVLEIGCGTGRNLIRAARLFPAAHFFGIDLSNEMLSTAASNVEAAGLGDRIKLARADATAFDPVGLFGKERFDRVFIAYALSMMPEWRIALSAALDRVSARGRLSAVDFGQQEYLPAWFRSLLFAWLARFHVSPRAELSREIARLAIDRDCTWQVRPLFRGYAWSGWIGAPPVSGSAGTRPAGRTGSRTTTAH